MKIDALLIQISTSYINYGIRNEEPQLGQYYIAEYAHQFGFEIRIKKFLSSDPLITGISHLVEEFSCPILGFYVDVENQWVIRHILYDIKRLHPLLFVIIGGPQVTGNPLLALKRIPLADIAIIGEGEIPFTHLLSCDYRNKENWVSIDGLAYRSSNGEILFTKKQRQDKEIKNYPFPKRLQYTLDPSSIFDQISTGRGCIGTCAFCFEGSKTNNILRLRPIESVIEEIDYVIEHLSGHKYISFLDDTFIINSERTQAICQHLIKKYNGDIKWFCEARVDELCKNVHLLPLMKKAGLIRIQLGGESGSQEVLDAYGKHMKVEELKFIVKQIYECGIPSIYINFIIGGAYETAETFGKTLDLALELMSIAPGCAEVGASVFAPYVGTPITNNPQRYGIEIIDSNLLTGPDGYTPFVETQELNRYKIAQLYQLFQTEVTKKQMELLRLFSKSQIKNLYLMQKEAGLQSSWNTLLDGIESISKYFRALLNQGFFSFDDLSDDELRMSVPYRTHEPVSDGNSFYRCTYNGEYKGNTKLEEYVLLLSSGKITFNEIVFILKKHPLFSHERDLLETIIEIYKKFDKEYLIVWKRDY